MLCRQRTFDLKPISKFVIIMNEGIVFAWAKMSFIDFALKTQSRLELWFVANVTAKVTICRFQFTFRRLEVPHWVILFSVIFRFETKHIKAELPTNSRTLV